MTFGENKGQKRAPESAETGRAAVAAVLLGLIFPALAYLLYGNISINLFDEGFLWYGTWRTVLGEVPILDFQAYDPGRYYWSAAWALVFGNGLLALRLSEAAIQAVGLTCALLVVRRATGGKLWPLLAAALVFQLWFHTRYKSYDSAISMAAVYFAVLLIENPSMRRHLATGIFVGLAAVFGKNHGLYTFVSFSVLIVLIRLLEGEKGLPKKAAAWCGGIIVGYSPILLMSALIPGFFRSFINTIIVYTRLGGTNLALQVPWPWALDLSIYSPEYHASLIFTGIAFVFIPLFYLAAGLYTLVQAGRGFLLRYAPLAASVIVGLTYMHHIFARADIDHMAEGIQPLLIGVAVLPFLMKARGAKIFGAAMVAVVLAITFVLIVERNPYYKKSTSDYYSRAEILGEEFEVSPANRLHLKIVKLLDKALIPPGEPVLVAPYFTMFYPIMERRSPLWNIYIIPVKESEERQREMIDELKAKNVNWLILSDIPLDNRDEGRFRFSHNLLWNHFMADFEPLRINELPIYLTVMRRK